ncbi:MULTISPECIES: hypothetical protein [unclassified Mesorhizobium]|uniref:hypothetical protein n=1 Tax=unclassified Mesorhizobium TaxID=325217 RepID=UPI00112E9278|nr:MULTISPECIES: hypothetical protein [unclassified Mesorhizobium]MBZ9703845.1 hypothetical protein [Mesorhizobium sp. CO1-1-3]MBZ9947498.1 hypothetical protein [Mesorhizobium sp. BR1-1-11]TPJ06296.1 hypothetical protein FJ428_08615 [Mesorhizobium sp. B2-8-1]
MINASTTAGREALVYSLVIPIFNEGAVLPLLVRRIATLLDALHARAEDPPEVVLDLVESRNTWAQMTRDRRFA